MPVNLGRRLVIRIIFTKHGDDDIERPVPGIRVKGDLIDGFGS